MSSLDASGFPRPSAPGRDAPSTARPDASALRQALGGLTAVLTDVALTADGSVRRRCPHRGVRSRCWYPASCRNQLRVGEARVCGGDAHVRFEPVAEVSRRSPGSEAG